MHLVLWSSRYSKGFVSAPSSSFPESWGVCGSVGFLTALWECSFFLRELQQAAQPKVTFVPMTSVLMKHASLWAPETQVLSVAPEGDLEQHANLSPCHALSLEWQEGSPWACDEVLPQPFRAKELNKVVNKGQPVQARSAICLALGLLSITFQMHWLPSLAGLSVT